MLQNTPLIATVAVGLVLAYSLGMIANRLRLPPLLGYLLAGIVVGPHALGVVADPALLAGLAEVGLVLLMFGLGLRFSLKDVMRVRVLAALGALLQLGIATALGTGLGLLLGWTLEASLLFGLALSVASTMVLLKALEDRRLPETERGRLAVSWLVVQNLVMVLALVLLPALASLDGSTTGWHDPFVSFVERLLGTSVGLWGMLGLTLVKLAAFVGFMLIVGRRIIPWGLQATAHSGSRELLRLALIAIALGVALGSSVLFGVSLALGAFLAGLILSENELSHRAAQQTLPLRDAFAVLFFIALGMLFDPTIVLTHPLAVLATLLIIIIAKSIVAFGMMLLFRRPLVTALTVSAALAQIGEFSLILATMGVSLAVLPPEARDLILAGAVISIALNPLSFWVAERLKPRFEARSAQRHAEQAAHDGDRIEPMQSPVADGAVASEIMGAPAAADDSPAPVDFTGHIVLVGFGGVGRVVAEALQAAGTALVVIEDADDALAAARAAGMTVAVGNATSGDVLTLAGLSTAQGLMITIADGFEAAAICQAGRKLHPSLRIIARACSEDEATRLRGLGADAVIVGEREIGLGMLAWLSDARAADSGPAAPSEPQLPPVENLLHKAAAAPAASPDTVILVGPPAPEAVDAIDPAAATAPVVEPEPAAVAEPQDNDGDSPAPVGADDITPAVGEAPAAIDEIVIPPAGQPDPEPKPASAAASGADTQAEADAQTSEGGIAPPEADAAVDSVAEPAPERVVPVVVPEPKN